MNYLAEARERLGLTQKQVSESLKEIDKRIDVAMVCRFEQELCFPTQKVLDGLVRVLQTPMDELYPQLELCIIPQENDAKNEYVELLGKVIPLGKSNAISTKDLLNELDITCESNLRWMCNMARQQGLVINNDMDGVGYYQPDTLEELERQFAHTQSRLITYSKQLKHLRNKIDVLKKGN